MKCRFMSRMRMCMGVHVWRSNFMGHDRLILAVVLNFFDIMGRHVVPHIDPEFAQFLLLD